MHMHRTLSKANLSGPASRTISVVATLAVLVLGLLVMSFIAFSTAVTSGPLGTFLYLDLFQDAEVLCVCSCGTKTKRLSFFASQPICK